MPHAARCTEILLRKGAHLKENGEDPPIIPSVIELALQSGYAPILNTVARIKKTNPGVKYLSNHEIISTLQQHQEADSMRTSLCSPAFARSILNFLYSLKVTNRDFTSTPQLGFLQSRLTSVRELKEVDETDAIPSLPTFVSLMRWKDQSGHTVFQDKTVGEDNFKMMLALAWSAVNENPELIPDLKEGISNLKDSNFIEHLEKDTSIISSPRNKELKEALETNQWRSIPDELARVLGLDR